MKNTIDPVLKQYSNKEIIHFVQRGIDLALNAPLPPVLTQASVEAQFAVRLRRVEELLPLLQAVDKKMNGDSKKQNIML